jgi:hypothetical protein
MNHWISMCMIVNVLEILKPPDLHMNRLSCPIILAVTTLTVLGAG